MRSPQADWIAFRCWYREIAQSRYGALQSAILASILPALSGSTIIALGVPGEEDFLHSSRIPQQIYMDIPIPSGDRFGARQPGARQPGVLIERDRLPLADDAIDVVVIPHVLEFEPYPTAILREVERILSPGGYVVITGFNPFSLWRIKQSLITHLYRLVPHRLVPHRLVPHRLVPHRLGPGLAPSGYDWQARWLAPSQLKFWLNALGLAATTVYQQRWQPSDRHATGLPVSVYALVAKKQVLTLTPIRPRWHSSRRWAAAAATQRLAS